MYEYDIRNIHTGERDIIFGYTQADAFRRSGYDMADWRVTHITYAD